MQHSVFISYSSREADVAIKVCEYLENNGIICWMAPRNVIAGSNYATQIVSAIKSCSVLVLLASENTNASGHVSNEVSIAFDSKKLLYRSNCRTLSSLTNTCTFWEENIGLKPTWILIRVWNC